MLHRIEVKGYKSIAAVALDLCPLNVLIGANGAGKSNLLQVFGLLNQIAEGRLQWAVRKAGGASTLLHRGPKVTPELSLAFTDGPSVYEATLAFAGDDSLFFEEESCSTPFQLGEKTPLVLPVGSGHRESPLSAASPLRFDRPSVLHQAQAWKLYHFHDTSSTAAVRLEGQLDDNAALRADASNLAAFLYRLRRTEPVAYGRIVSAVNLVAPVFRDFALRPDPFNTNVIQLEWLHHGSDEIWKASALSDGTLRFLCLATLLLQPVLPSMVIIDEPELGLHPYALHVFAGMLRSASTKACILVATQSVTLLNQLGLDDVIVVEQPASGSTFRRVSEAEVAAWVDEYSVGELWEKNLLGGRP